jgi:hypothetical protein
MHAQLAVEHAVEAPRRRAKLSPSDSNSPISEGGSSAAAHRLPTRLPSTGAAAERVQSVRRTEATGKRYRAALVQV